MACRALTLADYADARALYQALSTGDTLPDWDQAKAAFNHLLNHNGTSVIGAENKGRIIGMATLHMLPNMTYGAQPYGLIENVATLIQFERQGFGRAVMKAVAQAAWAQGAYKIMLLTGRENSATGFYEACGFDGTEKHGMVLRRSTATGH